MGRHDQIPASITRRNYWSNPDVNWGSAVTGTQLNDNARMIEENIDRMMHNRTTASQLFISNTDVQNLSGVLFGGTLLTTGNVLIQSGSNYTFKGETSIELNAGFETLSECDFFAIIDPCGTNVVEGQLDWKRSNLNGQRGFHTSIVENGGIHLFPNPVDDLLIVSVDRGIELPVEIKVLDIKGKVLKVFSKQNIFWEDSLLKISLKDLPSGVYFLNLLAEPNTVGRGQYANFKVIKK